MSPDRNSPEDCSCLAKGRASGSARPSRHEQKPHSQGRGMRGELAHGSKAHQYAPCRLACERHMARTPAVQQALSNAWLKAQGLVSVKDLWGKAQGLRQLRDFVERANLLNRPLRTRTVGGMGAGS